MLHPFPRHLYQNSPVIQLESSNISAVSLPLLFFSIKTLLSKSGVGRRNRLCSLDLRRPNLGRLNYTVPGIWNISLVI